jgi:hypothetical protein
MTVRKHGTRVRILILREAAMKQYCYVIVNNAGHSWPMLAQSDSAPAIENGPPFLPQLLQDGWLPIRETPMGGGTSSLAHSLVLLEREEKPAPGRKRGRKPK